MAVDEDIARSLEYITNIRADSWLRFEALYRADLARIDALHVVDSHNR
jgi:hypothetical protein